MAIASRLNADIAKLQRFEIAEFEIGEASAYVARTGYTGEDGVEFFGPAAHMSFVAGTPGAPPIPGRG